mmetsp:Transcript_24644/g.48013  ORF Transcript_24644/g.48013 Transcript_24644/m.48013 type:complete len:217 (+) Transcript_24644:906-1556(+)
MTVQAAKNSAASAVEKKTEVTERAGPMMRKAAAAEKRPKAVTVPAMMNNVANVAGRKTTGRTTAGESMQTTRMTTVSAIGRPVAASTLIKGRTTAAVAVRRRTTAAVGRPAAASMLATKRTIAAAKGRPVATSVPPAERSAVAEEEKKVKGVAVLRTAGLAVPMAENEAAVAVGVLTGKELVVTRISTVAALAVVAAAAAAAVVVAAAIEAVGTTM